MPDNDDLIGFTSSAGEKVVGSTFLVYRLRLAVRDISKARRLHHFDSCTSLLAVAEAELKHDRLQPAVPQRVARAFHDRQFQSINIDLYVGGKWWIEKFDESIDRKAQHALSGRF